MFLNNKSQEREIDKQISEASQRYKKVFSGEDGEWVLRDLQKRAFDNYTTYDPDPIKMGMNEGRRSLFKHIQTMVQKDLGDILSDLTKGE